LHLKREISCKLNGINVINSPSSIFCCKRCCKNICIKCWEQERIFVHFNLTFSKDTNFYFFDAGDADSDGDGIKDSVDDDDDNDGLLDNVDADDDGDGIKDEDEDHDGDGLSNKSRKKFLIVY